MSVKYSKLVKQLDAIFNTPFHFNSRNNICILGSDTFRNFMNEGVIFPSDQIVTRFIKIVSIAPEFMLYRLIIKELNNSELVKALEKSIDKGQYNDIVFKKGLKK